MRQFHAYRTRNSERAKVYPYLLNVQSDIIDEVGTRLVVPLFALKRARPPGPERLMPVLEVQGMPMVMMTPLMAGVDVAELGREAEDLTHLRARIMSAFDFLLSGI